MNDERENRQTQRPCGNPLARSAPPLGQGWPDEVRAAIAGDVRIELLGAFRVWIGSREIEDAEWYLRKPQSLLKLLALAPAHRLQEGALIALLWPGLDRLAASQILTKALSLVQRVLEPTLPSYLPSSYLHREGEGIVLDPPGRLWIDVEAFAHAVQTAELTRDPAVCERAARLYTGDLLPDDRSEPWTNEPREQLKALRLSLASCHGTPV
jgi:DNA-binding SARP family transcriptional activator